MKGIPNECITDISKDKYNSDTLSMYEDLQNGKSIVFDLIKFCKFKTENNFTTTNHAEFKRTIQF